MTVPNYNIFFDVDVCKYIYSLVVSKKINTVECSYCFFFDNQKQRLYIRGITEKTKGYEHPLDSKEFVKRYTFICFAYKIKDVEASSLTPPGGKRKPIKMKDVLSRRKIISIKEEYEEEEMIVKQITDTGATVEKLDSDKYLSVQECKDFFKNTKGKTKYAWYEDKETGEQFVCLELYKNTDYSTEDIDFLSTKYKYLFFAFEKNGAPVPSLLDTPQPQQKKKAEPKAKPEAGEKLVATKASQSSSKILSGVISSEVFQYGMHTSNDFLNLTVSKILWILRHEGFDGWSFFLDNQVRKGQIYLCHNSQAEGKSFICKTYLKSSYIELSNLIEACGLTIADEKETKVLVNAYLYEQRNKV